MADATLEITQDDWDNIDQPWSTVYDDAYAELSVSWAAYDYTLDADTKIITFEELELQGEEWVKTGTSKTVQLVVV